VISAVSFELANRAPAQKNNLGFHVIEIDPAISRQIIRQLVRVQANERAAYGIEWPISYYSPRCRESGGQRRPFAANN
jgi:hypothetical protein